MIATWIATSESSNKHQSEVINIPGDEKSTGVLFLSGALAWVRTLPFSIFCDTGSRSTDLLPHS